MLKDVLQVADTLLADGCCLEKVRFISNISLLTYHTKEKPLEG